MSTVHRNLTGADLHEPKGVDTALAGYVYVADGAGSGSWVAASTIITNTAFTTGDAKFTYKTTADTGWIMVNDGTIGDGSSSATTRANADTSDLFVLLWNLPASLTVSGGRGASAAADFAAHKTIALPLTLGRALVVAGAGSGLTNRVLAGNTGTENTTLTLSQLPTGITSTVSVSVSGSTSTPLTWRAGSNGTWVDREIAQGGSAVAQLGEVPMPGTFSGSGTGTATSNNTSGASHTNMQPSAFINVMVKL